LRDEHLANAHTERKEYEASERKVQEARNGHNTSPTTLRASMKKESFAQITRSKVASKKQKAGAEAERG